MNKTSKKITGSNKAEKECNDKNCPFHGRLSCRGRSFKGTVISTKMHKTAVVEWERWAYIPKYERYERKRTKLKAHNPPCINAQEGDIVKIEECRPLSKTKNFVVVELLGREKGFKEKIEAREEAKVKKAVKEKEDSTEQEKKEAEE